MARKFSCLIFAVLLVFLCISCVSAADNITDDAIASNPEDSQIASPDDAVLSDDGGYDEIDIRASPKTYKYSTSEAEYSFKIYNATSNTPIKGAEYSFDYSIDGYPVEEFQTATVYVS